MGAADLIRQRYWRIRGHYRPLPARFVAELADARVLEIGGPSGVFAAGGLLPVYPAAARVDNVQFAAATHWHDLDERASDFAVDGTTVGRQFIADDPDLSWIADATYDAVISSHVIEHFANPLRALAAWQRVTRPGGVLLMVAPHHEGTFDRRRPVTPLDHIVEDHRTDIGEDDLTHLDETLRLHDFSRDVAQDRAAWQDARRRNAETRVLHHHVFSTGSLLAMLQHAGLTIIDHETRFPHDIYVLGRWAQGEAAPIPTPDTGPFSA